MTVGARNLDPGGDAMISAVRRERESVHRMMRDYERIEFQTGPDKRGKKRSGLLYGRKDEGGANRG